MGLSLYVHIPFCLRKCFYCAFASFAGKGYLVGPYLEALKKEAAAYRGERLDTVYVGGGTPTFLTSSQLRALFVVIKALFVIERDAEITIEANPATFDAEKASVLFDLGVNRVSLGIQSLDDPLLKYLGRPHTRAQAMDAFDILRKVGFANVNLDLMYSLPGESEEGVKQDVADFIVLGSEHLSLYTLSVDEGSEFHRRNIQAPSSENQAGHFRLAGRLLRERGLRHYEVSNFAKKGFECRHNLNYWRGGSYIGLGVAAHSHLEGRRFWNGSDITTYLKMVQYDGRPSVGEENLGGEKRLMEILLIGLRLTDGVSISDVEERAGVCLSGERRRMIEGLAREGLLSYDGAHLKATEAGMVVLDELCSRLI